MADDEGALGLASAGEGWHDCVGAGPRFVQRPNATPPSAVTSQPKSQAKGFEEQSSDPVPSRITSSGPRSREVVLDSGGVVVPLDTRPPFKGSDVEVLAGKKLGP